jgi:hypothetical protein
LVIAVFVITILMMKNNSTPLGEQYEQYVADQIAKGQPQLPFDAWAAQRE